MKLSDKIRTLVRQKGIKMIDLANELGMSRQNLYNKIEANRFNSSQITHMANYFGVSEIDFNREDQVIRQIYSQEVDMPHLFINENPKASYSSDYNALIAEIDYLKKIIKQQENQIILLNKLLKIMEKQEKLS